MKQEEKSRITKTKILDVAIKLFVDKGYNETTMQDILSQTGLSKGAIYHHFRSKNEILEYAMDSELQRVTNYLKNLAETSEASATEKFNVLINFFVNNDTMKNLSNVDWAEKIPFGLLRTLRNTMNVLSRYIQKIIEQGNENNEFDCSYPFETASVLLLLIDIWLDPMIVNNTFEDVSKKIDYIAYFLDNSNIPVLSKEKIKEIKEFLQILYTEKTIQKEVKK